MRRVVAAHRSEAEGRRGLAARCDCDMDPGREGNKLCALSQPQVGYMGNLRCICAELCELGGCMPEVATALARVEGWSEVVLPEIEAAEKLQSECLGGRPPVAAGGSTSEFACLAAMRAAIVNNFGVEVDLSIEDLRDIDEDLDTQQVLDIAEVQTKQRA